MHMNTNPTNKPFAKKYGSAGGMLDVAARRTAQWTCFSQWMWGHLREASQKGIGSKAPARKPKRKPVAAKKKSAAKKKHG